MTPATTSSKTYMEGKYAASKPAAKVSQMPRTSFAARLDAGVNWFSRNLTGQTKRPESPMTDLEA